MKPGELWTYMEFAKVLMVPGAGFGTLFKTISYLLRLPNFCHKIEIDMPIYIEEALRPVVRKLNVQSREPGFLMQPCDPEFPIPIEWLRHYTNAFYFTDEELIAAKNKDRWAIPNFSGIYFYIIEDEIVYVGKAKNLQERMKAHWRNGMRWEAATWFEAPHDHLYSIESYYIHRIGPVFNVNKPPRGDYEDFVEAMLREEKRSGAKSMKSKYGG